MSALRWYRFRIFDGKPVTASLSMRGVDARTHAREMSDSLGFGRIAQLDQVHGARVIRVEEETEYPFPPADALVTDTRHLALLVRVADCAPVYLFDPSTMAIGLAHAGWRGLIRGVITVTVEAMTREFGTDPAGIAAAVGPSLGPCCARFSDPAREIGPLYQEFVTGENHVDLWGIARHQLVASGIAEGSIEQANRCTMCEPDFSSHRRGDADRMGAILGLR